MEQPPHQPCRKADDRTTTIFGDPNMARNSRQLIRQERFGRYRQGSAGDSCGDKFTDVSPLLLCDRCKAWKRATIGPDHMGRITDNETIGMTRNREILFDCYGSVWRKGHTERSG